MWSGFLGSGDDIHTHKKKERRKPGSMINKVPDSPPAKTNIKICLCNYKKIREHTGFKE